MNPRIGLSMEVFYQSNQQYVTRNEDKKKPTSLERQNQRAHKINQLTVTDNKPRELYQKSAWLRVQRLAFNSREGHGFTVQYLNTRFYFLRRLQVHLAYSPTEEQDPFWTPGRKSKIRKEVEYTPPAGRGGIQISSLAVAK
jgi:hypothetical protein